MTTEHTDHPDDTTEGMAVTPCPWCDPHEQTGSDAETMPVLRPAHVPLRHRLDNVDKWRMYRRPEDGLWYAYQPQTIDEPMFPAQDKYAAMVGGQYGVHKASGQHTLALLQRAMAKAAA